MLVDKQLLSTRIQAIADGLIRGSGLDAKAHAVCSVLLHELETGLFDVGSDTSEVDSDDFDQHQAEHKPCYDL